MICSTACAGDLPPIEGLEGTIQHPIFLRFLLGTVVLLHSAFRDTFLKHGTRGRVDFDYRTDF